MGKVEYQREGFVLGFIDQFYGKVQTRKFRPEIIDFDYFNFKRFPKHFLFLHLKPIMINSTMKIRKYLYFSLPMLFWNFAGRFFPSYHNH